METSRRPPGSVADQTVAAAGMATAASLVTPSDYLFVDELPAEGRPEEHHHQLSSSGVSCALASRPDRRTDRLSGLIFAIIHGNN